MTVAITNQSLVNIFSANDQDNVQLAPLSGGGYVAVWMSEDQNGSGDGLTAQIFNDVGQRVGGPFFIETTTTGDQTIHDR